MQILKTNTEICGHCAAMRPDNGYCHKIGRYVNFFDEAKCFSGLPEKHVESLHKFRIRHDNRRNRPITTANRTEKVCSCCGRLLPIMEFVVSRRASDGHDCYCRACKAQKRKQWKDAKKEKESAAND